MIASHDRISQSESEFVTACRRTLEGLPIARIKEAGFTRERSKYFLNIAYPSMQAMQEVSAQTVHPEPDESEKKVAVYVHVPFCTAECYYCHYYKLFRKSEAEVERFLDALVAELAQYNALYPRMRAESIYIGGGTPSYLTVKQTERLFSELRKNIALEPGAEVSFEMHPETCETAKLEALLDCGVTRLSMGIESLDDELLMSENRRHTAKEALAAVSAARSACSNGQTFQTINIDFIYGLRGQTIENWEKTIDQIRQLQPDSLTAYYLRLKHGTPEYRLWKSDPGTFPSDDDLLLMHVMNFEMFERHMEYIQNPVDWFIKSDGHSHVYQDHNWRKSDQTQLLGVGPSAYSYVNGWQYYNINDTAKYIGAISESRLPIWKGEFLDKEESARRTLMLGMKLGMDRRFFSAIYGFDVVNGFAKQWELLSSLGLVNITNDTIALTYLGKLFADEVGQFFYSAKMARRMSEVDSQLISTTWPQFNR